ncbi:putative glycolipid-binding domain-containing protein [Lacibacterium aquatile]|uniref:Glycolipid-binding domain-containing protein n=1 Tax=Lacibacterium aquatile TaxID=1168082 RepID=A0ABW5DN55_9PROT
MMQTASWRRLDVTGRDSVRLIAADSGHRLEGRASFDHQGDEARLDYAVTLDADWRPTRGIVSGWIGARPVERLILHDGHGWTLDGRSVGLSHCIDLDFGFTPATNFQQIRRLDLAIGETAELMVAWLDDEAASLTELRQQYERTGEHTYRYVSPDHGYEAVLELAPNGFVKLYPDLWVMVS